MPRARNLTRADGGLLPVRVQPRAAKDEVLGWRDGALRVRVTAAPEAGHANRAVIALLADAFDVPRSSIALVRGAATRDKLFRVGAHSIDALRARLGELRQ
jgi:uncharacterized protein (TIGR00251 family)